MLILNQADMASTVTLPQVMDTVEDTYRIFNSGEFYMPHRPTIVHEQNTMLFMPCFMKHTFGTKVLTLFPENPKKGLPYIDGLMLLNDVSSGKTIAIMDGAFMTAIRTGAVGGVGVRYFTAPGCRSVGLIGAGKQGFYQLLYATQARDIRDVYLYDTADIDYAGFIQKLESTIQEMTDRRDKLNFHICKTAAELVEKSEIVMSATTATSPVVPDDEALLKGKHFIAIGSYKPVMRELPNAIWKLVDHVYTELPFACEESGDLSQPIADGIITSDNVKLIGELLSRPEKPTPPQPGQTTYFKSVGMGLLDLSIAHLMYNQATSRNLGQKVNL